MHLKELSSPQTAPINQAQEQGAVIVSVKVHQSPRRHHQRNGGRLSQQQERYPRQPEPIFLFWTSRIPSLKNKNISNNGIKIRTAL